MRHVRLEGHVGSARRRRMVLGCGGFRRTRVSTKKEKAPARAEALEWAPKCSGQNT